SRLTSFLDGEIVVKHHDIRRIILSGSHSDRWRSGMQAVSGIIRAGGGKMAAKPKLLDQLREAVRTRHYSIRTELAYVNWARRFILFHGKRHPIEMGETEVGAFLTHLAVEGKVAASTQNQALSALLFLYREVLGRPLDETLGPVVRAQRPERLPVVLS